MSDLRKILDFAVESKIEDFEQDEDDVLTIWGTCFQSGKIPNKRVYIDSSELSGMAKSLTNAPLVDNHDKSSIENVIGKVKKGWTEGNKIFYKAVVNDSEAIRQIKNGNINGVSIGLNFKDQVRTEINGEMYIELKGIKIQELSLVIFPAVENTSIKFALEVGEKIETTSTSGEILQLQEKISKHLTTIDLSKELIYELGEANKKLKEENETLKKQIIWEKVFDTPWKTEYSKFDLEDYQMLWDVSQELIENTPKTKGRVSTEDAKDSERISKNEIKEDFREMMFKKRRDEKDLKGIRREEDLDNRLYDNDYEFD